MLLALLPPAFAVTECRSVDEFNAYMESHAPTDTVVLRFDATGVNPNDWPGTKGALADLTDTTCAAGGSLALKVYGPDDPPNDAHPSGTLKQEYGYNCGPMPDTETWADPNASAVVFTDGGEHCDITIWIDPATFGYQLVCDSGTFDGLGENGPAMPVNFISLFSLSDGGTWKMENASSTWNEVCFEVPEPIDGEDTGVVEVPEDDRIPASHDVTVTSDAPGTVYGDPGDLCVEAGYSEVYLQFDLSAIPGTITSATLELTAGADGSAEGSGAEVWAVAGAGWDEDSLTWSGRPAVTGSVLDRVGPIAAAAAYTLDVSAAVSSPGVYAFGLLPAATDTNGAHFLSMEGDPASGPHLRITWQEGSGGADTADTGVDDQPPGEQPPGDTGRPADPPGKQTDTGSGGACGCAAAGGSGWLGALIAIGLGARRRP